MSFKSCTNSCIYLSKGDLEYHIRRPETVEYMGGVKRNVKEEDMKMLDEGLDQTENIRCAVNLLQSSIS
jgi:hypothetical protein